jgi:NitT/TauT family transport system substrate-binding protein
MRTNSIRATNRRTCAAAAAAVVTTVAVAACGSSSGSNGGTTGSGETTVRIAVRTGDLGYIPIYVAQSLGYYKAQGLNVQFSNYNTGSDAAKAAVAGQADFATETYGGLLGANLQGADLEQTVLLSPVPAEVLMVSTKNHANATIAGLAGLTIGVSGLGTPPEFFVRDIFATNHLPQSAVKLASTGNGTAPELDLENNRVGALVQSEDPLVTQLTQSGEAKVLVDTRTIQGTEAAFGGPYPGEDLVASSSWIKTHKSEIQALNRAIVKALAWMQSHTTAQIMTQIPSNPWAPTEKDRQILQESLADSTDLYKSNGIMSLEGAKNVLRNLEIAEPNAGYSKVNVATTFDNSLVP